VRESELSFVQDRLRTAPIDVVGIIEDLGIEYEEKPMPPGVDGRIDFNGGSCKITVNSEQSRQRKNFTAAHELAHYLLHRDLLEERGHLDRLFDAPTAANPSEPFRPSHEVQANKLAAQILMPREAVLSEMVWQDYDLQKISRMFAVSPQAMEIRLKTLGIDLEGERQRELRGEFNVRV
jgi:Zn-dependent peptidase ImmA (M78 family)